MKGILYISILFLTINSLAQQRRNKLEYKSISFTPLNVYFDNSTGGLTFNADVSFGYRENIFTFSASEGSEYAISIFGEATPDSFQQLNLLYGKELKLSKTIFVDLHVGLGYFSWKSTRINKERKGYERLTTIGVPVVAKLRFKIGERFSLGLQFQSNFNSANNIYSSGILLQWNKKPSN